MPKSENEKAEIRRQNEARRQPEKDRSEHDAMRGPGRKRRQSSSSSRAALPRLSRDPLDDDEFVYAVEAMRKGSDRETAIMGLALVEDALRWAINAKLERREAQQELFHANGAPFLTFKSKITAAFALGYGTSSMMADLDRIREIRNQFSHALRHITFETPAVANVCRELGCYEYPGHQDANISTITDLKLRYALTCECIWIELTRQANCVCDYEIAKIRAGLAANSGETILNSFGAR